MRVKVCALTTAVPVKDINFLATSKSALIFKYVLAGTVHFDVRLVVHTMRCNRRQPGRWWEITERDTWRDTDRHTYFLLNYTWMSKETHMQLNLLSHCCSQKVSLRVNSLFSALGTRCTVVTTNNSYWAVIWNCMFTQIYTCIFKSAFISSGLPLLYFCYFTDLSARAYLQQSALVFFSPLAYCRITVAV